MNDNDGEQQHSRTKGNATLNLCLGDIEQGISKRTVSKMRAIDCLTEEGRAFGKWGWKENSSHE
jgi:hypothetical protein